MQEIYNMAENPKPANTKNGKSDTNSKLRRLSSRVVLISAQRKPSFKSQIEDLKTENQVLTERLEEEMATRKQLANTLNSIMCKVLQYVDVDELNKLNDSDIKFKLGSKTTLQNDMDYSELLASQVLGTFTVLLEDKFGENSDHMVWRLEELETRVTEQSQEIADQVLLSLKVQDGLDQLERCKTLEEVRDKIDELKIATMKSPVIKQQPVSLSKDILDGPVLSTPVPTEPPLVKLPAETHIRHLHSTVQESIIRELSLFKKSGADWRMFAHRVGIADETIEGWKHQRLQRPMKEVLMEWSRSDGASVRLLHRHLLSPQLRCRILAKRVADFYKVD